MRHVVSFRDWSARELNDLIDLGLAVKREPQRFSKSLEGKSLLMVFQKTSTRTRVSFEVGITELGGHAVYLDWRSTNIPISDLGFETEYLSRNCSFLMARMLHHEDLMTMVKASSVPVINGLDDHYHPTQVLSDYMTIKEKRGSLKGARIMYIGMLNNVSNSLVAIGCKLGVDVFLATPLTNQPSYEPELLDWAKNTGYLHNVTDPKTIVEDVDAVYVDTWVDMEFFTDPSYLEEKKKRLATMMPYTLSAKLMGHSKAMIMHDMPIHPGYEIQADLVHDPRSIIFVQAENLRHSRKALLVTLADRSNDTAQAIL